MSNVFSVTYGLSTILRASSGRISFTYFREIGRNFTNCFLRPYCKSSKARTRREIENREICWFSDNDPRHRLQSLSNDGVIRDDQQWSYGVLHNSSNTRTILLPLPLIRAFQSP